MTESFGSTITSRRGNLQVVGSVQEPTNGRNVQALRFKLPKDGAITLLAAHAGGYLMPTRGQICLWEVGDATNPLIYQSPMMDWATGARWLLAYPPNVGGRAGKEYIAGYVVDPLAEDFLRSYSKWSYTQGLPYPPPYFGQTHYQASAFQGVPENFVPEVQGHDFAPSIYVEQVENYPPITGEWIHDHLPDDGVTSDPNPIWRGTLPHHPEELNLDYTSLVHVQITRQDNGQFVYNSMFEPTETERRNGKFERRLGISLPVGVRVHARFRHADRYGVWSQDRWVYYGGAGWSSVKRETYGVGPSKGLIYGPSGRLNVINGYNYSGKYEHPTGAPSQAIYLQVHDADTGTMLYQRQTNMVVASGSTWTVPMWHQNLKPGVKYYVEVWPIGNSVWGWSGRSYFHVNSLPYQPTKLSPTGGATGSSAVLSGEVRDPDGDTITQVRLEIANASTGATLPGYPKVTGSIADNKWSYNAASDLAFGNDYQWRIQGNDGQQWGEYCAWQSFSYRQIPTVSITYPTLAGLRNQIARPSAEYQTSIGWWTDTQESPNLLTANQASFETDLTGIFVNTGATIARNLVYAEHGSASLSVRVTIANENASDPGVTFNGIDGTPGATYSWQARVYCETPTVIRPNSFFMYEDGGSYRNFARLSADTNELRTLPQGWSTISGTGVLPADTPASNVSLRFYPPRKSNNTGYDSTKTLFFDKVQVEVAPAPTTWSLPGSRIPGVGISSINDGDAAFGTYAWRGETDGTTRNTARRSPKMAVNALRQYWISGQFKKEDISLDASATFRVRCFNSSNTLLGTVVPASAGGLDHTDVGTHWEDYGGFIGPSNSTHPVRWPVGTTQIEIEIIPVHLETPLIVSPVRFDAFALYELTTVIEVANQPALSHWFGYFDGDTLSYRGFDQDFYWEGVTGESASIGIHVLESSVPSIIINFNSPDGNPKVADQIMVDRWSTIQEAYERIVTGDWTQSARTVIPIPSGLFVNENHYRIQVGVRDNAAANAVTGYSNWINFDMRAVGPPELNIVDLYGDPETANVTMNFEQTQLGVDEFGGIEIRVQTEGQPAEIFEYITDPTRTSVIYPFPVSGATTFYSIRQIQHTETEDIASRWVTRVLNLDYYPRFFLKDVTDPLNIAVAWTPHPGAIPSRTSEREQYEYVAWGSKAPTHLYSEPGYEKGEISVWLRPDPNVVTPQDRRYEILEQMDRRRRTLCFLSNAPRIKRFVSPQTFSYSVNEREENVVNIGWTQDSYLEDYYEREED